MSPVPSPAPFAGPARPPAPARLPPPPRPYLEDRTEIRVRFSEVDSLRIVWHGHYVAYLEEARRAFGRRYELDYPVFLEHGVAAPVVQLELDFLAPARLQDVLEVTTRFFKSDCPKLEFAYAIRRVGEDSVLATGSTVQVFTTFDGELLPQWPPLMIERYRLWEGQWLLPTAD